MPKGRVQRTIDIEPAVKFGTVAEESTPSLAPPAVPQVTAPDDLVLTTTIGSSTAAPTAIISAAWSQPSGVTPDYYAIQVDESDSFPDATTRKFTTAGSQPSIAIPNLKPATTYYVRVAAKYRGRQSAWTSMSPLVDGENYILTESDTTPAAQPTSLTATWIGSGDLLLTWTNPDATVYQNFKDAEITIKASSGTAQLGILRYSSTGRYLYTAAMNLADTSDAGDPSLYVEVRSRTFSNVVNNSSVPTVTTTKPVPTTPTVTHSWSSETLNNGVAGPDLTLNWTGVADARTYRLTLDGGTAREISATRYTYPLDTNRADHSGTPDAAITYSLVAVDGLGQSSTAASGTATNHNPPTTAVTLTAGFSAVAISATPSAAADLRDYTFRIIKDGSTLATYRSSSPDQIYKATARGSYQVGVIVNDVYGQASTETISSAVVLDALTITELRSAAIYTDSDGNVTATLDALKDGVTASGGVTYGASAGWKWTQIERPLLDRYRTITVALSSSASVYLGLSSDGTTWTYYYGGTPTASQWTPASTTATEATAQSGAVSLNGTLRIDLSSLAEARYIRLGHRHATVAYTLREFCARRLVQSDDIEAEAVRAINIAAATITADKLSVLQLSAITADMGSLTAGTITGGTVQTASSGARVVLSGAAAGGIIGYGASDTYSVSAGTGTYQVLWQKTTGKLLAGSGTVTLDSSGVGITGDSFTFSLSNLTPVTPVRANAIQWTVGSGTAPSVTGSSSNGQLLARGQRITLAMPISTTDSYGLDMHDTGGSKMTADTFIVDAGGSTSPAALKVQTAFTTSGIYVQTRGGLNVGNTTAAGVGEIVTTSNAKFGGGGFFSGNFVAPSAGSAVLGYDSGSSAAFFGGHDGSARKKMLFQGNIYEFQKADGTAAAILDNSANLKLASGLYIGGTGTTPSYQIHLSADSAGKPGTNTWTVVSDERTKDPRSIRDYTTGRELIEALRPVVFRYNGAANTPTDEEYVGFIAQEVEAVAPGMVKRQRGKLREQDAEETDIQSLNTNEIQYAVINTLKDILRRLDALEQRSASPRAR